MSKPEDTSSQPLNRSPSKRAVSRFPQFIPESSTASRSPSIEDLRPGPSALVSSPKKPATPKRSKRFEPYTTTPPSRRSARLATKPAVNRSEFPLTHARMDALKRLEGGGQHRKASPTLSELLSDLSSAPSGLLTPTPERELSPGEIKLQKKAEDYVKPKPVYVPAPLLPKGRVKIDTMNVDLFAEDGAPDVWKSAFSFERFMGPRKMAPFRELHLLTDPPSTDFSDWAENVRWAKEQHLAFGSVWLENEFDLERITEWRREHKWVSNEVMKGHVGEWWTID